MYYPDVDLIKRRLLQPLVGLGLVLLLPLAVAEPLSLAHVRGLLAAHPSLASLQARADQWETGAAGAMGLPNPTFTLGLNNLPLEAPLRFDLYLPSSRSLEVMQTIPNRQLRESERDTGMARAGVATLEGRQLLQGLEQRLFIALAERQRIEESLLALERQLALLAELERWLTGEMEAGGAVYGRFDELDVQRGRIKEQRLTLEGEDLGWQAELRELVDLVPDTRLPALALAPWNGEPGGLMAVALAARRLEVARSQVAERRAALLPGYALAASYQQRESGANFSGGDWFTLKASISLPLWAASNQRPKLAAAQQGVTQAQAELAQRLAEARNGYEKAVAEFHTADALLRALAERADKLRNLEASNRRRYESGEGSLEKVILPAMQRVEIATDLARQKARRNIAVAKANALLLGEQP